LIGIWGYDAFTGITWGDGNGCGSDAVVISEVGMVVGDTACEGGIPLTILVGAMIGKDAV